MDFSMSVADQLGLVVTVISMFGYVSFMRAFSAEQRIRASVRVRR